MVSARSRWELTPESLDVLLDRLSSDRHVAAMEYEALRRRLVDFFDFRGCPNPDLYADETLDRVARKLEEGAHVEHVARYAYGVARVILLESTRDEAQERLAQAGWRTVQFDRPLALDDKPLACLEKCLPTLAPDLHSLLIEYYRGEGRLHLPARKRLADRLGISYGALKVRAHRARTQLEECLRLCLGTPSGEHE